MPRLNDLEAVLLSAAAARTNASLLPFPTSAAQTGERLTRALASLLRRGLVEEHETAIASEIHRTDGDLGLGLFITAAGCAAIGVETAEPLASEVAPRPEPEPRTPTKASRVLALLGRTEGATLAELIAETGWLPHTTRAALTGLRKKGHVLEKTRRANETCYQITVTA